MQKIGLELLMLCGSLRISAWSAVNGRFQQRSQRAAEKSPSQVDFGRPSGGYFFSLMQKSVFWPRRKISPAAIAGVAMKI